MSNVNPVCLGFALRRSLTGFKKLTLTSQLMRGKTVTTRQLSNVFSSSNWSIVLFVNVVIGQGDDNIVVNWF